MADRKQHHRYVGPLAMEIEEFIDFKRSSGSPYTSSESALKAFDRFCAVPENQKLTTQQFADAWMEPDEDKPKYDGGCCVRQLGQYLTEQGSPKAFTALSVSGRVPVMLGINPRRFEEEINKFVDHKRSVGRKYSSEEYCLKGFDKFCSLKEYKSFSPQQVVDIWVKKAREKSGVNIGMVREFGIYLTMQGSEKSFVVPYANGGMPKPEFTGYTSLFAEEIESFINAKRSEGLKYRTEEFRLKDFDRFCNEHLSLFPQQLADAFIQSRKDCGYYMGKRSASTIKEFGKYLCENGRPNAFAIIDEDYIVGPYAEEISAFVDFKKSCGFKYLSQSSHLRNFDVFCASMEDESLTSQQLADRYVLKREGEHPNTRAGRVEPVRVFGKYLTAIGHPKAFTVAADTARRKPPAPPYLFSGYDIDLFFSACASLEPDEKKDPTMRIVLPAAFLFMHCMGVRTCELKVSLENVDFKTGKVVIVDAKNGDRVIYMSEELSESLFNYNLALEKIFPNHKHLFPKSASQFRKDFAMHFSKIWASAVPAMGSRVPRLYDFRHHLLYRNVELCMRKGNDVNVLRPYLMRHMGHRLPESFQYYFHLSPPIRKEVSKIKNNLDWMIPDVPEVPYE